MFHHKAFVIRWLILFAPILLKLCTVSPVPPFTDNRSFAIRDNYLYGDIHCYCSSFFFFFSDVECGVILSCLTYGHQFL